MYVCGGGLNKNAPNGLIDLNTWLPGSVTIRRNGLGVSMALLEKECNWALRF